MNRRIAVISSIFLIGGAFGCQAILGIDDTSFQSPDTNDAASDATSPDGGPGSDGATADGGTDAATSAALSFSPARVFVRAGGAADVTVTLNRNGFAGAATIALVSVGDAGASADGGDSDDGGPDASEPATPSGADGVSIPTLTIPSGSNTGTLHVFASASAPLGVNTLDFTVDAGSMQSVSVPVLIAGPAGTVDPTFGTNGIVDDVSGGKATCVAIADDDSVYVAGNGSSGWLVRHYDSSGIADATFDGAMAAALASATGSVARIAVHGSAFVLGGQDGNGKLTLRKYTTSGLVDATFGVDGMYQMQEGAGAVFPGNVNGVAFSSTGLVLATARNTTQNVTYAFRFHPSANEDRYAYPSTVESADVRLDTTGNIIVGGSQAWPDGGVNWFASRLDGTFQDAGTQVSGSPSFDIGAVRAAVTPDGRLAVVGVNDAQLPRGAFATFDQSTLNSELVVNAPNGGDSDNGYSAIAGQSDGKILVSGSAGGMMTYTFVRRYDVDAAVDTSFGNDGIFSVNEMNFGPETFFEDIAIDSWGRIVAVGYNTSIGLYMTRIWP
jgi:hypothetical protein